MKRFIMSVLVALAVAAAATPAYALLFTDFVEFGAPGLGPGDIGSISVFDDAPPAWLHDVHDDLPAGVIITAAALLVSYRGTDGNESWSLVGDGVPLGPLSVTASTILTTSFPLSSAALAALEADDLLNVVTTESTPSRDGFRLYQATLSGDYQLPAPEVALPAAPTLAPEPGTLALSGLGGLAWAAGGWRRKRAARTA